MLALPLFGQRKADIGIFVGVPWYLGDISPSVPRPTAVPPAIGPIYRYNFNMRNSLRVHGIFYDMAYSNMPDDEISSPDDEVFAGQKGGISREFRRFGP